MHVYPSIRSLKTMQLQILLFTALIAAATAIISFNYNNQTAWGDIEGSVCTTGREQSPIDIRTSQLTESDETIDLVLEGWNLVREGTFANEGGHTVQFTPNNNEPNATTINHQGTYVVQQIHMHWGENSSVGSEHRIDGKQTALEIHFVHRRTSGPNDTRNALTVVAIMAVAGGEDADADVWSDLNVLEVQEEDAETEVTLRYSDLLPSADLSYYYYEGSLTTPLCTEIVQWFVLKERITVPQTFLQQLRTVSTEDGTPLVLNYREVQDTNGRDVVMHASSATSLKSALLSFVILVAATFLFV